MLDRVDPRWVALLLVPVLLAAGAAQPSERVPRAGAVVGQRTPVLLPAAAPPVLAVATSAEPAPAIVLRRAPRSSWQADRTVRRAPLPAGQRGRAALRALRYDPAALGYAVRFLPYRGDALGTTNRRSRLITVYVRRGQSELTLRATIAHEIGHALDFVHGNSERRAAYREIRRLPDGQWFPCHRCNDFASPAGDFAEVFAVWLAGPGDFRSRLAGPPDDAQLRALAPLFALPAKPSPARSAAAPSPSASPAEEEPDEGLTALIPPPPGGR